MTNSVDQNCRSVSKIIDPSPGSRALDLCPTLNIWKGKLRTGKVNLYIGN